MTTVSQLSFQDQLETILDTMDGDTLQDTADNQEDNESDRGGTHYHGGFIDDFENDVPYVVGADIRDRDGDHRPRVAENIVEELQQTVNAEKPSVPAEKFDFDTNLGVVLDLNEDYYETLQCKVSVF